jgi:hypothetical protein
MAFGDMFGAMGGAARGTVGMGGGNGGSFAQKQMMRNNPVMQPQGGMGAKFAMARQQAPPSTYGMQGPNKMRPSAGMPFGNQMRQDMMPGIGPRFQGQMGGIAQGMGAPWMQQRPQPTFPQDGGMMRPQVQGPNGEAPSQQGGLAEMFRRMQMQQGGGIARPHVMPNRGIAPQLSMMPQMMQQPRQPNPWGQEYDMQAPQEEMY